MTNLQLTGTFTFSEPIPSKKSKIEELVKDVFSKYSQKELTEYLLNALHAYQDTLKGPARVNAVLPHACITYLLIMLSREV